jgi:hypothetical protein
MTVDPVQAPILFLGVNSVALLAPDALLINRVVAAPLGSKIPYALVS